jgi:hypothetical protein
VLSGNSTYSSTSIGYTVNYSAVFLPIEPVTSTGRLQTIPIKGRASSSDHVSAKGTLYRGSFRLLLYSVTISFRTCTAVALCWSYQVIRASSVPSSRMSCTDIFSITSVVSGGRYQHPHLNNEISIHTGHPLLPLAAP